MSDRELLRRAQAGDADAWRQLYERVAPAAWSQALAYTQRNCEAEEIVSEALLALVRNLQTLDAESCQLHGWLRRVVRSKAVDRFRRERSRLRLIGAIGPEASASAKDDDPADASVRFETRRRVMGLLGQMRDTYRTALVLKYGDGLSIREIAVRLELSEKAAESLLNRARCEFRDKYRFDDKRGEMPSGPMLAPTSLPATQQDHGF